MLLGLLEDRIVSREDVIDACQLAIERWDEKIKEDK